MYVPKKPHNLWGVYIYVCISIHLYIYVYKIQYLSNVLIYMQEVPLEHANKTCNIDNQENSNVFTDDAN